MPSEEPSHHERRVVHGPLRETALGSLILGERLNHRLGRGIDTDDHHRLLSWIESPASYCDGNYAGSGTVLTRRDEVFGALARHSRQPGIVHRVPGRPESAPMAARRTWHKHTVRSGPGIASSP